VAVMALLVFQAIAVSAQTAKETPAKPAAKETPAMQATAMAKGNHMMANTVAVCACGMVFLPNAGTKTFSHDGKEYACCSEECHMKLASMPTAEAAKACEDQVKKLTMQAQAGAMKK
jgi:hypothetical protein